jgi:2,3-bisphosphoglycerate-dependent phosphoglycerate mutase
MAKLILVRHCESEWNRENRFTGWSDVPLSARGIDEAIETATHISDFHFDVAFTSQLHRAHETLLIILSHQNKTGLFTHYHEKNNQWYQSQPGITKTVIPIHATQKLNERYYGALQGMKKTVAVRRYGVKQVFSWRRGWQDRPPGNGESIKDTYQRAILYLKREILPKLDEKKNVLVVGHGSCLRAIIKYLEDIPDSDIPFIELPNAQPIIYKTTKNGFLRTNHSLTYTRPLR